MSAEVDAAPVRGAIARACDRAGRDPGDVQLLAAVKYLDTADVPKLLEAGVTLLGENREQQLREKVAALGDRDDVTWHFIGRLQSRKVKTILPLVELVHSVESDSVLEQLARHGDAGTRVLVQVNVAEEEGKGGVAVAELDAFLARTRDTGVTVDGLMTMPPAVEDPEGNRPFFRRLRELADERGLRHCSMGTSQDYAVAAEEGATIVRVGSALLRRP